MRATQIAGGIAIVLLLSAAAVPATATATQPADQVDECTNAEEGPGEQGPPGFVASLVPGFVSDLIGSLPVPNFVKSLFGAATC